MLIQMKTTLCGPYGNFAIGEKVKSPEQISEANAKALVPLYADDITPASVVESAVIEPQETAVAAPQRRSKRRQ